MTLFTDPPSPGDTPHHPLIETSLDGPLGGPSYAYRGAVIDCLKGGHVCRLTLDGHPLTDKRGRLVWRSSTSAV